MAAQRRHREINGARRAYFCGAYWRYGFHEDGVNSALAVAHHFGHGVVFFVGLGRLIHERCWSPTAQFYFDLAGTQQVERFHVGAYWTLIAGIVLGIIGMFQPWFFPAFRYGFYLLLASTIGYIAWSHISPAPPDDDLSAIYGAAE